MLHSTWLVNFLDGVVEHIEFCEQRKQAAERQSDVLKISFRKEIGTIVFDQIIGAVPG